jgi:UDP-3-O-[3-hydroxymyristoyl] glucosamine N-acyltransferase
MSFTAQQIADFIQGKVEGDATVRVSNFSKIEEGQPGTLSFLSNPKYSQYIYDSNASFILVNNYFVPERAVIATLIRVANAYESLAFLLSVVEQAKPRKSGISPQAFVSESAQIGENAYIAPFVSVGDGVRIGKNVQILSGCTLGDMCSWAIM